MLLDFMVENWMSYRDEANLNLTSSLERQHRETLTRLPGFRSKKVLPVAAIYGGNASGKTALFKALAALKAMVTRDEGVSGMLPVVPFALDEEAASRPTTFDITFLAGETTYRLVVEATRERVSYESLEVIREKDVVEVYERDGEGRGAYSFDASFFTESDHVEYAAKSTRANRLFLGSAVAQNVTELSEAYGWFANTLELVGVESHAWSFATAADKREGFLKFAGETLSRLDTGIAGLIGEDVALDALPKDAGLLNAVERLGEGDVITVVIDAAAGDYGFEVITIRSEDGRPHAQRIRTVHEGPDGRVHPLTLAMESSGTQRLMGLLPMLFDLSGTSGASSSKVYVVDELDRCLHTMLTSRLIEDFLSSCGEGSRKQLLFTTHDLLLMDQSLMRRDEMYIAQRNPGGCSELVGLAEYEGIRYDRDLIRSYLEGRFGGIPMLGRR